MLSGRISRSRAWRTCPAALGTGQLMLHRLGRDDDELIYRPDNPRLLARPYVSRTGG
jgi:hypothetical protein